MLLKEAGAGVALGKSHWYSKLMDVPVIPELEVMGDGGKDGHGVDVVVCSLQEDYPSLVQRTITNDKQCKTVEVRILLKGSKMTPLAEALNHNTTITTLLFPGCMVDDDALKILCKGMVNNTTITALGLNNNRLRLKGKYLANLINTNTTITALDLSDNIMKESSISLITKALTTNTTITAVDLADNASWAETPFLEITQNNTITNFHYNRRRLSEDGVKAIEETIFRNNQRRVKSRQQQMVQLLTVLVVACTRPSPSTASALQGLPMELLMEIVTWMDTTALLRTPSQLTKLLFALLKKQK